MISISHEAGMLHLRWPDGSEGRFPYFWLKENDPAGFHPDTKERMTDQTAISLDIVATDAAIDGGELVLEWSDGAPSSRFDLAWLFAHRPGHRQDDPAKVKAQIWRGDWGANDVPRARADDILEDDHALASWLHQTQAYGLSVVEGLADHLDAGMDIAKRIGFLRETNFGTVFEVQSKPNPNNLAYTSVALPTHTDLTNQELPPGFQFLHCLANEAEGGGSVFCDGYAIARDLRAQDPAAFDTLTSVSIPFRFHDDDYDIRSRKHVITLDIDGNVHEICFNAHLADFLDIEPEDMTAFYRAYTQFMKMARSDDYCIHFRLERGEMVVFDNRRVLHGRDCFDPSTGFRHLRGCYVDRGEFESRMRVLARG